MLTKNTLNHGGTEVKIEKIGKMTDSGATGGGALINGKACSGWYVEYDAITADGDTGTLCITHYYDDDRELVKAEGTYTPADSNEEHEAEGRVVADLIEEISEIDAAE